jgi:hypothetical protein
MSGSIDPLRMKKHTGLKLVEGIGFSAATRPFFASFANWLPQEFTNGSPRFSSLIRAFMFPIRFRTIWDILTKTSAPRPWQKS